MIAFDSSTASVLGRRAIDELLEAYVAWREECQAVWLADQLWIASDRGERRLAYAAYVAVLDREERAAGVYAEAVERVARIETRDSGPNGGRNVPSAKRQF
jgi:hypothetical protein